MGHTTARASRSLHFRGYPARSSSGPRAGVSPLRNGNRCQSRKGRLIYMESSLSRRDSTSVSQAKQRRSTYVPYRAFHFLLSSQTSPTLFCYVNLHANCSYHHLSVPFVTYPQEDEHSGGREGGARNYASVLGHRFQWWRHCDSQAVGRRACDWFRFRVKILKIKILSSHLPLDCIRLWLPCGVCVVSFACAEHGVQRSFKGCFGCCPVPSAT